MIDTCTRVIAGWQGESPMVPSSEDVTDSRQSPPPEFASDELVVTDDVTSSTIKQELQELGMSKMDQQKEQGLKWLYAQGLSILVLLEIQLGAQGYYSAYLLHCL